MSTFSGEEIKRLVNNEVEAVLYKKYDYMVRFNDGKKTITITEE